MRANFRAHSILSFSNSARTFTNALFCTNFIQCVQQNKTNIGEDGMKYQQNTGVNISKINNSPFWKHSYKYQVVADIWPGYRRQ